MKRFFCIFLLLVLAVSSKVRATPYYTTDVFWLDTNGSDSNDCLDIARPCLLASHVLPLLGPGDTLNIRGGNYESQAINNGAGSGGCLSCTNGTNMVEGDGAITIQAYNGETVSFGYVEPDRSYWIYRGISVDGQDGAVFHAAGIDLNAPYIIYRDAIIERAFDSGIGSHAYGAGNATYHKFINLTVRNNGLADTPCASTVQHHGSYDTGNYNLYDHVEFYGHTQCPDSYGMQLYGDSEMHFTVIRNCKFHDNSKGFTVASGAHDNLFYNNLVYDNTNNGVESSIGQDNLFYNNTVYSNGGVGFQLANATRTVLTNNIAYSNANGASDEGSDIYIYGVGANSVDSVLVKNMTGTTIHNGGTGTTQTGNVTGNPNFTNPPTDFTVSGTPPNSSGSNLSSVFTTDYAGNNRPGGATAWTIGALESNAVSCGSPDHLTITSQPSSAVQAMSVGTFTIEIRASNNALCTSATNTITITKHSGVCTGMTLAGTGTGAGSAASGGIFTTTNVTLSGASGSCSLDVAASGLAGATSSTITISGSLIIISPVIGNRGDSLSLSLTGAGTAWVDNTSVATFSASGVTVIDTVVNSATSATVTVSISPFSAVESSDVTMTTGMEVETLSDGFHIGSIETLVGGFTVNAAASGGGSGGGGLGRTRSRTR